MGLIFVEPNRKPNGTQIFKIQLQIIYLKYQLYLVSETKYPKFFIFNRITKIFLPKNFELFELPEIFVRKTPNYPIFNLK